MCGDTWKGQDDFTRIMPYTPSSTLGFTISLESPEGENEVYGHAFPTATQYQPSPIQLDSLYRCTIYQ